MELRELAGSESLSTVSARERDLWGPQHHLVRVCVGGRQGRFQGLGRREDQVSRRLRGEMSSPQPQTGAGAAGLIDTCTDESIGQFCCTTIKTTQL